MKRLQSFLVVIVGVVAAAFVFVRCGMFPYEDLRYRLTITVNVDGEDLTGSSVTQIRYTAPADIFPERGVGVEATGQALLIDLGKNRALVGLLISPPGSGIAGAYRAEPGAIPVQEFKLASSVGALKLAAVRRVQSEGASAQVSSGALPLLAYLANINDPASAKLADPDNLAAALGDRARFVSAHVETVYMGPWPLRDFVSMGVPVSTGIERAIPWSTNREALLIFYEALKKGGYNPGSSIGLETLFIRN